jgi:Protein of unknown function (DUF3617)
MKLSFALRLVPVTAILALGSTPPHAVAAEGTVPGDRWEVISQMSMEGMPMALPPNKIKVCSPKEWKEPPGGADERRKCTNSDFKLDGTKATWNVTCAGPPAMTGTGEITRESDDAWSGAIKFMSADGAMTIKLSGRKLEECEARP